MTDRRNSQVYPPVGPEKSRPQGPFGALVRYLLIGGAGCLLGTLIFYALKKVGY